MTPAHAPTLTPQLSRFGRTSVAYGVKVGGRG